MSRVSFTGLACLIVSLYLTFVLPSSKNAAMPVAEKLTTVLSTKGQVILPKAIRDQRHWEAGTRLMVEQTADGVLLRAASIFAPTRPEEVFASLAVSGAPKTLDEMNAGIAAEAKRRHARHRY
jgi:AbrB family looped-hinge helix DNA binding protein